MNDYVLLYICAIYEESPWTVRCVSQKRREVETEL
ncbi:unnamed protein product [Haemonchus placei]|uniref:Uncharacterized protein n=1 Tax=Haemonchus placei TaxID=6290 RepID=A0A0N4WH78_HAEPC|nr:unnamed protein product [Haemonchus placei]